MRSAWAVAAVAGAALLVSVGGWAAPSAQRRRARPDAGTAAREAGREDAGHTWEDVKRHFDAVRRDVTGLQQDFETARARAEADGGAEPGHGGRADAGR